MSISDDTRRLRIFFSRADGFFSIPSEKPSSQEELHQKWFLYLQNTYPYEYDLLLAELKFVDSTLMSEVFRHQIIGRINTAVFDYYIGMGVKEYNRFVKRQLKMFVDFFNFCCAQVK